MEDPVANSMIADTIGLLKELDALIKDTEDELISGSVQDLLGNFKDGLQHSIHLFRNKMIA